jgi:hypothetical protein
MRSTRHTKKTIRHTLEGEDVFSDVELVRFMDEALLKPNQRYQIKVRLERWTHQACKHWEKVIWSEPHWRNLNFRYSSASRSFLFTKK